MMNFINTVLGTPLGVVIWAVFQITGSFGLAILGFTIVVRCFLLPVSIFAHKNSLKYLRLLPSLNVIKKRYAGDRDKLGEEQYLLFKKEGYNAFVEVNEETKEELAPAAKILAGIVAVPCIVALSTIGGLGVGMASAVENVRDMINGEYEPSL